LYISYGFPAIKLKSQETTIMKLISLTLLLSIFCFTLKAQNSHPGHPPIGEAGSFSSDGNWNVNNLKSSMEDFGNAPEWKWIRQFGGSGGDLGRDVAVDPIGNAYLIGTFSGNIEIGASTYQSVGAVDMILIKINQSGTPVWVKQISPSERGTIIANSIALDDAGDIVITGEFSGLSANFQLTTLNRIGTTDLFVAKYSTSGSLKWAKNYGVQDQVRRGLKIDTDADNNVYVISYAGSYKSNILKYDKNGGFLFSHENDGAFLDLSILNSTIYFTGNVSGTSVFGDSVLTPQSYYGDAFIAKSDLDLNFIWATMGRHIEEGESVYSGMARDGIGNVYMIGYTRNNVIFHNDTIKANGPTAYFLTKCSPDGEFIWSGQSHEGYCKFYNVEVDTEQNPYIFGSADDASVMFEDTDLPDVSNFIIKCNSSGVVSWVVAQGIKATGVEISAGNQIFQTGIHGDLFISRSDINGTQQWYFTMEGNSGTALVNGIEVDNEANVYTYGDISGDAELFGSSIENFTGSFLAKHNSKGDLQWIRYIKGGTGKAFSYANILQLDKSNSSLYLTGKINDTLVIGNETLYQANGGTYFARYGVDGTFKWAFQQDGPLDYVNISVDYQDNLIISGTFEEDITIGTKQLVSLGFWDVFLAKYNSNGVFSWALRAGGDDMEYGAITSVDNGNNIYLAGEFYPADIDIDGTIINTNLETEGDVLLAKFNASGALQWVKTFGSGKDYERYNCWPTALETSPSGYSYVTGWNGDSVYFDDHLLVSPYDWFSFFTAKIDPLGNTLWVISVYEHKYDFNYNEMDIDQAGNAYIMARFRDTLDFQGEFTLVNQGVEDMFIAKYSNEGDLDWVKFIASVSGSNFMRGIGVYDTMSLYVGGEFYNQIYLDDTELSTTGKNGFMGLLSSGNINCEDFQVTKSHSDIVCPGLSNGYIDLSVSGGTPPFTFNWSNGATTEDLEGLQAGTYVATITDDIGCSIEDTTILVSVSVYEGSELCLVTVNQENKIIVVWEKVYDQGIASYNIYREVTRDNYIKIATVDFNSMSIYLDEASLPAEYSHYYKIAAVDQCGNVSTLSPYHKSIHLWSSVGVAGEVTLNWEEYEGFFFGEYRIYRGPSLNDLFEIRTISSSAKSWTDPNPPSGKVYYRVEVVKDVPCFPTKKSEEYGSTYSNYDEESISAVVDSKLPGFQIYPNPFSDFATLRFHNPESRPYTLRIMDLSGQLVRAEQDFTSSEFILRKEGLSPGIYFIELRGPMIFRSKMIIE
jgi:hypothetical protein